jgi:hypothetical protein
MRRLVSTVPLVSDFSPVALLPRRWAVTHTADGHDQQRETAIRVICFGDQRRTSGVPLSLS